MFVEDHALFFADYGVTAIVGGETVSVIFDNGYSLGNVGPIGMASSQPVLKLATANVPVNPVGAPVVIGEAVFSIGAHEPDGTGMSRLLLEAV